MLLSYSSSSSMPSTSSSFVLQINHGRRDLAAQLGGRLGASPQEILSPHHRHHRHHHHHRHYHQNYHHHHHHQADSGKNSSHHHHCLRGSPKSIQGQTQTLSHHHRQSRIIITVIKIIKPRCHQDSDYIDNQDDQQASTFLGEGRKQSGDQSSHSFTSHLS